MTLPAPKLDGRTHDDLLAEAMRRLPLYAPEYTNHNESDPGRAILSANAFLIETLLFQINRVPEQNQIAFLNLIGIKPRPARAARTELAVTLKDLKKAADPLLVEVPLGTQVAVDDPALDQEIVFETDRSLRALNADFGLALIPSGTSGEQWRAITRFDSEGDRVIQWLHAFHAFGDREVAGNQFLFALALRPRAETETPEDRMPAGPLDVFVEATEVLEPDSNGDLIDGPRGDVCGPLAPAPDEPPAVQWEVFADADSSVFTLDGDAGWVALNVSRDQTGGLRRSGHVTLEIPRGMVGVRLGAATAAAWDAMGLTRSPRVKHDLIELLCAGDREAEELKRAITPGVLAEIGVPGDAAGMLSDCESAADLADALAKVDQSVAPSVLSQEQWAEMHPRFAAPGVPVVKNNSPGGVGWAPLYFFRVTLKTPQSAPRLLNRLRLNVAPATAASTRRDERLGVSNGRPGQTVRLARTPIYFDPRTQEPDLELTVTHEQVVETWRWVEGFHGHGPADKVFVLDEALGQVRFGDGRPDGLGGAIPPPGAVIRAARYRFGGGRLANVARDTVTRIKGAVRYVESVTNPRAASDGADGETLDQVLRRAPSTLRRRERAVSAADFADLARETPGAAIHKAWAIAARVPDGDGFRSKPGAVSVVILPDVDHPTPQPTERVLTAVGRWLEPRRLITTELHVIGPRYFRILSLNARLGVSSNTDFGEVTDAARSALLEWLNPVRGGADGAGWPMGSDVFHADLYDLLLNIPGVRRVSGLVVTHDPVAGDSVRDVIPVPEGYLPALMPGAVGFEVGHV